MSAFYIKVHLKRLEFHPSCMEQLIYIKKQIYNSYSCNSWEIIILMSRQNGFNQEVDEVQKMFSGDWPYGKWK